MTIRDLVALAALAPSLACGGSQAGDVEEPGRSFGGGGTDASDLDTDRTGGSDVAADPDPEPEPPVTIVVRNSHRSEGLFFNMDRGYGGFTSVFSGKPPKATVYWAFPRHCTAGCDRGDEERCPTCPEPDPKNQVLHEVAPGATMEIPWDGRVHLYEKVKGRKRTGCECYRLEEVPPESYTVRVCGLRLTRTAKQSSKPQCAEGQLAFPADGPQRVELEFGAAK